MTRQGFIDLLLITAVTMTSCSLWAGLIWLALRAAEAVGLLQAY